MDWLIQIIVKYWLGVLFGLIVTVVGTQHKKIKAKYEEYKTLKQAKADENMKNNIIAVMTPILEDIASKSNGGDSELRNELGALQQQLTNVTKQLDNVTTGMLNVQGNIFKRECHELLDERVEKITQDQYDKCMEDHKVYNTLGGNHDGDQLFELVTAKYMHKL